MIFVLDIQILHHMRKMQCACAMCFNRKYSDIFSTYVCLLLNVQLINNYVCLIFLKYFLQFLFLWIVETLLFIKHTQKYIIKNTFFVCFCKEKIIYILYLYLLKYVYTNYYWIIKLYTRSICEIVDLQIVRYLLIFCTLHNEGQFQQFKNSSFFFAV